MTTKTPNVAVSNDEALLKLTLTLMGKWTHTASQIRDLAEEAEKRLDRIRLPVSMRKGVIATHIFKGPVARAYGYSVNGSIVTLRRAATGWRVIGFAPQRIFPQQGGELELQITPEQQTVAVSYMWRAWGFVTKRPALPVAGEPAANLIAPAETPISTPCPN